MTKVYKTVKMPLYAIVAISVEADDTMSEEEIVTRATDASYNYISVVAGNGIDISEHGVTKSHETDYLEPGDDPDTRPTYVELIEWDLYPSLGSGNISYVPLNEAEVIDDPDGADIYSE